MKRIRMRLGFLAMLISMAGVVWADDVTVSVIPGSEIPTLEGALEKVRALRADGRVPKEARVTIRLAKGIYRPEKTIALTQADSHLTIVGAGWNETVLNGGVELKPFTAGTDGLWRTTVPAGLEVEEVFVAGHRAQPARAPNEGWFHVREAVYEGKTPQGVLRSLCGSGFLPVEEEALKVAKSIATNEARYVYMHFYNSWDTEWVRFGFVEPDLGAIVPAHVPKYSYFKWPTYTTRFRLLGVRSALDAPGEWFFDRPTRTLLYVPREGEKPETARAEIGRLETLMTVVGREGAPVEDVRFENMAFCVSGFFKHLQRNGEFIALQSAPLVDGTIRMDQARSVHFDRCRFTSLSGYALNYGCRCSDSSVTRCFFNDLGAGGVRIGNVLFRGTRGQKLVPAERIAVKDCLFTDGGRMFPEASAVSLECGRDCAIVHNEISDIFYNPITVGYTQGYGTNLSVRNLVGWNYVHDIGLRGELNDMGGIYVLGVSPGSRVIGNVIHDIWSYDYTGGGGVGIYTDEGSSDYEIASNLVYRCKTGAVNQNYGRRNILRNNVLLSHPHEQAKDYALLVRARPEALSYAATNNVFCALRDGTPMIRTGYASSGDKDLAFDRNLYWPASVAETNNAFAFKSWQEWRSSGHDPNGEVADPKFVDVAHDDFRLRPDSPAFALGFKAWNYADAGLTDEPMRRLAASIRLPKLIIPEVPPRYEGHRKVFMGFEAFAPRALQTGFFQTQGDGVLVVEGPGWKNSARCLEVREQAAAKQRYPYCPLLEMPLKPHTQRFALSFALRFDAQTDLLCEMRDYAKSAHKPDNGKYAVGPHLYVRNGGLEIACYRASNAKVPFARPGEWAFVTFAVSMREGDRATWALRVENAQGERFELRNQQGEAAFRRPGWIGFLSNGPEGSAYYLDDFGFSDR